MSHGAITFGDLMIFNGYSLMIFGPFMRLGGKWA
jgi:hypothetical protein